jgi:DNA-binding NarL/FixJ family response regulator
VTTVAVAEASAVLAAGARAVLEQDGLSVWTASSLEELLGRVAESPPEIALVDLALPPAGGRQAIEALASLGATRTLAWSFDPSPQDVLAAVAAGAVGFLTKEVSPSGLLAAVRRVAAGEAALDQDLAGMLVTAIQRAHGERRVRESLLTPREEHVLALVSQGLRNREIAVALGISEFTVKRHVQNILRKLELPTRRAAARFHGREAALATGREEAA